MWSSELLLVSDHRCDGCTSELYWWCVGYKMLSVSISNGVTGSSWCG